MNIFVFHSRENTLISIESVVMWSMDKACILQKVVIKGYWIQTLEKWYLLQVSGPIKSDPGEMVLDG